MADRINIDKKLNAEIIKDKIDKKNILGLGKSKGEDEARVVRTDMFLFAMAIGADANLKTASQSTEGLVLENTLKKRPEAVSYIYSMLASDLIDSDNMKEISNSDLAYETGEQYANTGLKKLREILDLDLSGLNEEDYIYKMLKLLDEKYDELFGDVN